MADESEVSVGQVDTGTEQKQEEQAPPSTENLPEEQLSKEPEKVVPEEYAEFKVEEGAEISKENMIELREMAKSFKLSQEEAQKLVDLGSKAFKARDEEMQRVWSDARESWVKQLREDKEYGGKKLDETITRAQRVMKKFGTPELSQFLDKSGFGDNYGLIVMLAKIDKMTGEDTAAKGGAANKVRSLEDRLFTQE